MAGTTIRTPGDHSVGVQTLDLFGYSVGKSGHERAITDVVAELPVGKTEENRRLCAEGSGRAFRLVGPRGHERVADGPRIGAHQILPLRSASGPSVARDDQVNLYALWGVAREDGRRCSFVIGMSEQRDERPRSALRPGRRRHRDDAEARRQNTTRET